ncbi:DUF5979 domain-containing protein [Brevibacterium sp. UBA7493]|uniref:DUF5979 domain-containing protein n=1 Tax=Brevibacterium sp. UBA7493 TaxID=1946121 RepID=UPI00258025A2|nr:DUF5979 domain-containing protein [Brevibacterium sp. UBA7493]
MSPRPPVPRAALARPWALLLTLLLALSSLLVPQQAFANGSEPSDGSPIVFTDISFENDAFASGTQQRLNVEWKIEDRAQNPVRVELALPAGLSASNDRFGLAGPDGETAGECTVQNNTITCTADEDFINANPYEVSGDFFLRVTVTENNKETVERTFDIGGFDNTVTLHRNVNWCTEDCTSGQQRPGKRGWYDNINDRIVWTVGLPAGDQGMKAGETVTVTDIMDEDDYTLLREGAYPRVLEAKSKSYNSWGREGLDYRTMDAGKVQWSDDYRTATFTTESGLGSDYSRGSCDVVDGIKSDCTRGTDGTFYEVQWHVEVNTPGDLQPNGDRLFYNGAEYTIAGEKKTIEKVQTRRQTGGGNIVGRNFGKFQVTKELQGDTTLNPQFEVTYSYQEKGQERKTVTKTFRAGDTFTSEEIFRDTTVTIEEIKPTDPDNVTWDDPVSTDEFGDPVTELTFSVENGNLGNITKLKLTNRAMLERGSFKAAKAIENPDDVPLSDDLEYTLAYSYPANGEKGFPAGSGTLTLPADGTVVESGKLPVGAELTLEEINLPQVPGGTWEQPTLSQDTLTIGEDEVVTVDVTNTITQDLGSFQVTKSTSGDGQELIPEGTEFTVTYSYEGIHGFDGGSGELTVKAGETSAPSADIPAGATVTLEELNPVDPEGGTWGDPQFSETTFTIQKDQVITIDLDNPITLNEGTFSVTKAVEGDAAHLVGEDVAFTVDYDYTLPEGLSADPATGSGTLTVLNDGQSVTADPLPYGTEVALSEVEPGPIAAATWTGSEFDHSTFTIGDETSFAVTLTNSIELDLGAFSVQKSVTGNGAHLVGEGTEFTVNWSYPEGEGFEADSGTLTVTAGGEPVTVSDLPTGAQVTLEEEMPSNPEGGTYTGASWDPGNTLTIGKDTTAEIGLENTIELNTGDFSVVKVLDGSGAGLISEDATFTVDYEYESGPGFEAGSGQLQLNADGEPVSSGPLPYGAEVHLSEATPVDVEGATWSSYEFSPSVVTIGDGKTAEVTLTNTFGLNDGYFSVSKALEGPGSGLVPADTEFVVEYSYPAGNGFEAGSGSLTVKADGEAVTSEALPYGAVVTLAEVEPVKIEGGTWVDFAFSTDTLTIGDGTTVEVLLTNTHDLNGGHFSILKVLEGSGTALVDPLTEFTVEYSYPAGNGFEAGSGELTVRADGTVVTSDALPFGAEVTLAEVAPVAIEGGTWSGHEFSKDTFSIGDRTTVEVTLTNTIEADIPEEEPCTPGDDTTPGDDDGSSDECAPGEEGKQDDDAGKGGDGTLPRTGTSVIGALLAGMTLLALGVLLSARASRRTKA